MTRRGLLAGSALLPSLFSQGTRTAAASGLIKPNILREGSTVGLITPSTYVADPDRIALAEKTVAYFGLKLRMGRNVGKRYGYVGGSIEDRIADLHDMFRDPSVDGVFAIRGGYGTPQILDRIDYDLIRRNPKVFLGYSDITAMHLAIHQRTGLVTFHGPMPLARFPGFTQAAFRRAIFDSAPLGTVSNPPATDPLRPAHNLRAIRPGKARGRLIGGNLTLVCTLMGTPYEIDTRGKILMLEDVGEEPYRIDRMLTQLRLAGKLDAAAGIIWGECSDCGPKDYKPSFESTISTGEVAQNIFGSLKIPVLSGLTIGHTDDQLTLPVGVMATLDADAGQLVIEESAYRS